LNPPDYYYSITLKQALKQKKPTFKDESLFKRKKKYEENIKMRLGMIKE